MFRNSIFWLYGNERLSSIKPEDLKKGILDYSLVDDEYESRL